MTQLCRRSTLWAVLLFSVVAQLPAATAAAKKRAVILPFSGPRGATARAGVARALKRRATLINPKRYLATARKLGVDPGEPEGIQAACAKIKCDAVIKGSVNKRRRRYTLTVTLIDASSGEPVARRAATVRGVRRLGRAGAAIGSRLGGALRKTQAPRPETAVEPPPPPPPPDTPPPPPPSADISDIPHYRPPGEGRTDEDKDEDEEEEEEKGSSLAGLFDVSLAVGLSTRTAEVIASQNPANNGSYDGGMFPEIIIRADVYPLVPFTRSFFRNIGISATFLHHLAISSKNTEATTANDEVGTTSRALLIDLKLRWPLLSSATTPELIVLAGFGLRDFNLDPNPVMTSFNYRFLRLGLEAVIPFGTSLAAAFVGGDARPLLSTGVQSEESYGALDGGFGYSARAGFCGEHRSGIMYFLGFEYLGFSASFVGVDPSLNPLAEWPNLYEPSEQSDRFIRFWAGGGYSF